tara:strand:+ start:321 stop:506 length:186 start_codon:yes stop_codon:yes gene_type:complete
MDNFNKYFKSLREELDDEKTKKEFGIKKKRRVIGNLAPTDRTIFKKKPTRLKPKFGREFEE